MLLVLDTNVVSELMRPQPDQHVLGWVAAQPIGMMAITAITIMEIRYGIACLPEGARKSSLEAKFRQFLARGFGGRVLPLDEPAAEASAAIRAQRRRMGQTVGTEDCMIAGIARHHGATVATRDEKGFEGHGVMVVNPWGQRGMAQG